jgi:hypothetical protein
MCRTGGNRFNNLAMILITPSLNRNIFAVLNRQIRRLKHMQALRAIFIIHLLVKQTSAKKVQFFEKLSIFLLRLKKWGAKIFVVFESFVYRIAAKWSLSQLARRAEVLISTFGFLSCFGGYLCNPRPPSTKILPVPNSTMTPNKGSNPDLCSSLRWSINL